MAAQGPGMCSALAVVVLLGVLIRGGAAGNAGTSKCTLVTNNLQYDITPLAKRDHWFIEQIEHDGSKTEIYFSLCHGLRGAPAGCRNGNNNGVCISTVHPNGTKEVIVTNAGIVSAEGPVLHYEHRMLEYEMDNGTVCHRGRRAPEKYSTYVNFICDHTLEEETDPVVMSFTGCQLRIAWMTPFACPLRLDVATTTPCSIQYPTVDHTLHLQTLRAEQFYSTTSADPKARYEVNICGGVVNGSCGGEDVALCYVGEGGEPTVFATTKNMSVRWESDDSLILAYKGSSAGKNVDIKFVCDQSAIETVVNYVVQNDTAVVLSVRSSAVCPPTVNPSCVLMDDVGNVYDLRPLHRMQDNWDVIAPTQNALYYFNLCGPLNPGRHYICPYGMLGACMVNIGGDAAYNLGLLTSKPIIDSKNGTITVVYTGGDTCKGGNHSHSTRINLICSTEEQEPMFVRVTETCEHVFDWLTPVACKRHFTTGSNCTVSDPQYGNVYNLNPLRNARKDYKVAYEGSEFRINVCGPLVSSCDGRSGEVGVCELTGNKELNAGLYTDNITFNDGTLLVTYASDTKDCEGNRTRSSQIIYLCDHESSGRDGPLSLYHDGCTNKIFWKTKYACPSFNKVDCTLYTTNGLMYDLHELSSTDSNMEYYTADQKKFVFNVCRSVVHQRGSRCAYRAGACIIDRTNYNDSVNIGEVGSGPYLDNGKLMVRYSGGEQCEGHVNRQYQTLIEFICDRDETYPLPQLIGEENCTYYFQVKSAAACPVTIGTESLLVGKNCSVTSPSDYVFDLSSLKQDKDYVIKTTKGSLTLNVCAPLNTPQCMGKGVGGCTGSVNVGKANADLHYLPEHLSLMYTGGDECREGVQRSTIITFVCGAENATEGPQFVFDDEDHCMYFITWYTELACEKRISCFVDTWAHRINLSPLIKSTGNYETTNPNNAREKFYLNVCRPLNPIVGVNCRPGSAVCLTGGGDGTSPTSLGHPNITPVVTGDKGASIMYKHGAKCTTHPDYNYSSKINFICDPSAGKGNPVFKELTHDCQYIFEWRTSAACDMSFPEEELGPLCQIRYDKAKTNIDLKPLYKPEGYDVKAGSKTFKVNVCGSVCNSSGTCTADGDSYGLSSKSDLSWQYGKLTLEYFGGSDCSESLSGHKSSTIIFECDMSAGFGYPVAESVMGMNCIAVFYWRTNVTCIEGIYATSETPTTLANGMLNGSNDTSTNASVNSLVDETSSKHSMASAIISTVLVVSGLVIVAALVIIKSKKGNHFIVATRKLFGIHTSNQTPVENSTLLGATSSIRIFRADESDDDLLRV